MDQPTLEYLAKNATEFISGIIGGTIFSYRMNRNGLLDRHQIILLGYAFIGSGLLDIVEMAGLDFTLMKAAQGDIGNSLGLYLGLNMGRMISKIENE